MATYMWNAQVVARAPVTSIRDENDAIARWTRVALERFVEAKLLPAKAIAAKATVSSAIDALLPVLSERRSFTVRLFKRTAPPRMAPLESWIGQSLRAELGREAAPAPLSRITVELQQASPDAAITDELRFAIRLVANGHGALLEPYPLAFEPTFDAERPALPLVFAPAFAPALRVRTRSLSVLSEPRYLAMPDAFSSTAW